MAETKPEDLNAAVSELFKCPVCFTFMSPPIHRCEFGHTVCSECNERIQWCPICRGKKSPARVPVMESSFQYVNFHCKFKDEGCEFTDYGWNIKNHEAFCEYHKFECPLIATCSWKGTISSTLQHCEAEHAPLVLKKNVFNIVFNGFLGHPCRTAVMLVEAYGELFLLTMCLSRHYVIICVYFFGPDCKDCFTCNVKLGEYELTTECASYYGRKCMDLKNSCFLQTRYHLNDLCEPNGNLKCEIRLMKKSENLDTITNETVNLDIDKHPAFDESNASNLEEALIEKYRCNKCSKFMEPPFYQCGSGYSYCNLCNLMNLFCTTSCRNESVRLYFLEELYPIMELPCKNKIRGCNFKGRPEKRMIHEERCELNI